MRRHTAELSMETTLYRGPNDEVEIEVEVTGTGIPYRAATLYDPEEGGLEEVCATLYIDGKGYDIPLSDEEVMTFEEQLMDRWREDYDERE